MEINNILTGLKKWTRNKYPKKYGAYGSQRGFERKKIYNFDELRKEKS